MVLEDREAKVEEAVAVKVVYFVMMVLEVEAEVEAEAVKAAPEVQVALVADLLMPFIYVIMVPVG